MELHRNFAVEGETNTCKKLIQSHRRLHDATGWLPRHSYTMYTLQIGPPRPPATGASGVGRGSRRFGNGEVESPGFAQIALRSCRWGRVRSKAHV